MFLKAMQAEALKFKRSPVFLAFAIFTLLAAVLGTLNYTANLDILENAWYSLWTQHTLFACSIFLPAELGVLCAWQWRLEHTDHCWNALMSAPVPFAALYMAKLAWAVVLAAGAMVFTAASYLGAGALVGLPLNGLPPELTSWLVCGWLGCVVVCAWQLLFAMCVRSFALPVAAALLCGVGGLLFMAKGYGLAWPWAFLALGMRANNPQRVLEPGPFCLMCAVFTLLPTLLALAVVKARDVVAE